MGSYPVTQGQGERKRVQEKMQALCVCKKLLCRSVYAQASLSGPRTLGRGFSALELQVARASSLDSEHTEAQRGTAASPVSRSHPPERHLTAQPRTQPLLSAWWVMPADWLPGAVPFPNVFTKFYLQPCLVCAKDFQGRLQRSVSHLEHPKVSCT